MSLGAELAKLREEHDTLINATAKHLKEHEELREERDADRKELDRKHAALVACSESRLKISEERDALKHDTVDIDMELSAVKERAERAEAALAEARTRISELEEK